MRLKVGLAVILILLATLTVWWPKQVINHGTDPVVMLRGKYTEDLHSPSKLSVVGGRLTELTGSGDKTFFGCYGSEIDHISISAKFVVVIGCSIKSGAIRAGWAGVVDSHMPAVRSSHQVSMSGFSPWFWDILGLLTRRSGPEMTALLMLIGIATSPLIRRHQPMVGTPLWLYYTIGFGLLAMFGALSYLFGSGLVIRGLVEGLAGEMTIGLIWIVLLILSVFTFAALGSGWLFKFQSGGIILLILSSLNLLGYWPIPLIALPPLGIALLIAREEMKER